MYLYKQSKKPSLIVIIFFINNYKSQKEYLLFELKATAISNFPSYHPYKYMPSILISGL
jgi:hypothetical protein